MFVVHGTVFFYECPPQDAVRFSIHDPVLGALGDRYIYGFVSSWIIYLLLHPWFHLFVTSARRLLDDVGRVVSRGYIRALRSYKVVHTCRRQSHPNLLANRFELKHSSSRTLS